MLISILSIFQRAMSFTFTSQRFFHGPSSLFRALNITKKPSQKFGAITFSSSSKILAEQYPRGHKELRGSFFNVHNPMDTMTWFSDHGVELKTEEDGRVFPVSNSSSSVIDCLMSEAKKRGAKLRQKRRFILFAQQHTLVLVL